MAAKNISRTVVVPATHDCIECTIVEVRENANWDSQELTIVNGSIQSLVVILNNTMYYYSAVLNTWTRRELRV